MLNAGRCGEFFRSRRRMLAAVWVGVLAVSSAGLVCRAWKSAPSAVRSFCFMSRGLASTPFLAESSRGGIGDGEAPAGS